MNAIATIRSNEQGAYAGVEDSDRYAELSALMTPDMLVRLRKVVTRYAHGVVDVDDLMQDAIERALRNWDSYKAGTNLMAWMRTIIQRMAIDQWRRRGNRTTVSVDDLIDPNDGDESLPSWSQYSVEDVRRAMASLTPDMRLTYQMHYLDGLCYQTIASRLGIALATVGTRLARARIRLRELLEREDGAKVIDIRGTGSDLPVRSSGKAAARWSHPHRPPLKHLPAARRNGEDLAPRAWPAASAASC
jgi:RNA polymerase sigma-70 factor (ECF subfamily)